jgi:hypothetical protein
VHLRIPDVPSLAARDAMRAEDALIKYERGDWDPELHPRTGTAPNPGWFATKGGHQQGSPQDELGSNQSGLRVAANEDSSPHANVPPMPDDRQTLQPGNPLDEPANLTDRHDSPDFWSNVWPTVRNWLKETVPEYDLESGQIVGERPRWRALAPYVGISAATASVFGLEAFAPTFAAGLGLGGGTAEVDTAAAIAGPRFFGSFTESEEANPGTTTFGNFAHKEIAKLLQRIYPDAKFIFLLGRENLSLTVKY